MELKEFITKTLTEIIDGVSDAQKYAETKGAKVNPGKLALLKAGTSQPTFSDSRHENFVQIIDFDIAVVASDNTKDKAGIGVFAGAFGIGGQMQNEENNSNNSRIKFSIPIFLPTN
jgi:hypothetical protein